MNKQSRSISKVTRTIFWIAGSLLVLASFSFLAMNRMMAGMQSDVPSDLDYSTTRASEKDIFRVSYTSPEDGVPVNQMHQWTLHMETLAGYRRRMQLPELIQ